jgi:hypothetical protein
LHRVLVLVALTAACSGGATPGRDGAPADGGCLAAPLVQLAYSTDGRWLAAAHADGIVTVFELAGVRVHRLKVATAPPRVALTEDGGRLVVAAGGTVAIWSLADGTVLRTLTSGAGTAVSVKLSDSPTPDLLVAFERAAAADENVKVWRAADGILIGLAGGAALATFTHADAALLMLDEAAAGFDVVSFGARPIRHAQFPQPLAHTAFAADGAYMGGVTGAGSTDERLAIMSVSDEGFTWVSAEKTRGTRQLVFLENPSRVLQLGERALLYDHNDGKVLMPLPALDQARLAVAAPDGSAIAAVIAEKIVLVSTADGTPRMGPDETACARP